MLGRKSPTARDGFVRGAPAGGRVARRSLLLVAAAALIGFLAIPLLGQNGLATWFGLRQQEQDLAAEVAALEEQVRALEAQLDDLAGDPAMLEKMARERFNMRGAKESVLLVVE